MRIPSRLRVAAVVPVVLMAGPAVVPAPGAAAERVVLVIIDGLRYSEGLGDPLRTHVPEMAALAEEGTVVETFRNDNFTYTARAIPAIWCGAWTNVISFSDPACGGWTNSYAELPTVFEYYRKGLGRPASDCVYVLKDLCSWKGSFHPSYGPAYWPTYHEAGETDVEVWEEARTVITSPAPRFLLVYFADVDHAGHSGDWTAYLRAIAVADSLVGELWRTLQASPAYAGETTMLVTNDHGRHYYNFTGHGDSCSGCRAIQLLAVGPDIRRDHVSTVARAIPDITPTIGRLLEFPTPLATGAVMEEILRAETGLGDDGAPEDGAGLALRLAPNPMSAATGVRFTLDRAGLVHARVHDLSGRVVATLLDRELGEGEHEVLWDGRGSDGARRAPGIYFVTVAAGTARATAKAILLR